jgi:glycine/D-amino acid oxidase-like deaminating enzyme
MLKVDYLIIGQGISGTFLSHYLQKHKASFVVIDEGKNTTASKVASGVINPITGRRLVTTWRIEELLPFAKQAYSEIDNELSIQCCKSIDIIDFFATPQMKLAFEERQQEETRYLQALPNNAVGTTHFKAAFGAGLIKEALLIDLQILLQQYTNKLLQNNQLFHTYFDIEELIVTEQGVQYKDIQAGKIIFCDGVANAENRYFNILPYAPNKGEALLIEIKDLPHHFIYKYGLSIVPWKNDLFWVGSTYQWQFEDDKPTTAFREKTNHTLQQILKVPFTIVQHLCAVRPANIERRPFVGFHPKYKNVGVFNGMGTKGCSLAPYFAHQFVEHLLFNQPLLPEVDIRRFEKILAR